MQGAIISKARLLSVAIGATLVLAACGGGGDDAADPAPPDAAAASTTITMSDNTYAPSDPVVAAGDVELVNDGQAPHTFTIEGEDVDVEVAAGETATASVELEPGTYTVFCEFHRAQGMETTLTVQ